MQAEDRMSGVEERACRLPYLCRGANKYKNFANTRVIKGHHMRSDETIRPADEPKLPDGYARRLRPRDSVRARGWTPQGHRKRAQVRTTPWLLAARGRCHPDAHTSREVLRLKEVDAKI